MAQIDEACRLTSKPSPSAKKRVRLRRRIGQAELASSPSAAQNNSASSALMYKPENTIHERKMPQVQKPDDTHQTPFPAGVLGRRERCAPYT